MSELLRLIRRSSAAILLASAVFVSSAYCQPPETPRKPLRERLLERANKGDVEAQFDLGKSYEAGRAGLPQDFAQARHWYLEAARQKDPFAEASLGIIYNMGKGVPHDYVVAYFWFDRSISHLTGAERDTVAEMRESLSRKMTAVQIAEAQRRAKEPGDPVKQ